MKKKKIINIKKEKYKMKLKFLFDDRYQTKEGKEENEEELTQKEKEEIDKFIEKMI